MHRNWNQGSALRGLGACLALLCLRANEGRTAQTVFRCQHDGQKVLTDQPCPGSKSGNEPPVTLSSAHNPSTVGKWQGQMQYAGTESGEEIQRAHSVASLELEFTADGKVSGLSTDNGCHWLGVWSQGGKGIERIITLNLSLSNCQFTDMNRRFTGTYLLGVPDDAGQMQLVANTIPFPGQKARMFRLDGTLRRQ